jgi:hypothetical protein
MGLRFRKRFKIAPGLSVNLSKSGTSLSVGKPGATLNLGKHGARVTTGVPGTGLSYSQQLGHEHRAGGSKRKSSPVAHLLVWVFLAWAAIHFFAH